MFVSLIKTSNYSEKCKMDTWSKRTQTKPILPAMAGKIALSEDEGPIVSNFSPEFYRRAQSRDLSKNYLLTVCRLVFYWFVLRTIVSVGPNSL